MFYLFYDVNELVYLFQIGTDKQLTLTERDRPNYTKQTGKLYFEIY